MELNDSSFHLNYLLKRRFVTHWFTTWVKHATFFVPPPVYFCSFFPLLFSFAVFFFKPAAAIAQSVERLTGEREVAGLIPGTGPTLLVYNNWEMKALPLPCKWLDLHVARMTTLTGGPVSSKRRKNSVPS